MVPDHGNNNRNHKNAGMFVRVMTDEQMEDLRKQIVIYATICEQLVDLHKSLTSHHDLAGVRLGHPYYDPLAASGGHRFSGRQRWTPTSVQLQTLERLFDQGNGTPSKQKIKEIASDLSQHGPISETNVYNWFQNRRARSKRKQQTNNNGESEVETEVESKKTKSEDSRRLQNPGSRADDGGSCFRDPKTSFVDRGAHKVEPAFVISDVGSRGSENTAEQLSYYESMLANPRMDHIFGKMKVPEIYHSDLQGDNYNMMNRD